MDVRLNVWHTNHPICDTVARSLAKGFGATSRHVSEYDGEDYNIAYGVLRGTADIFRQSRRYFIVDNGFSCPGHFTGNYRISYRGTQPTFMAEIETDHSLTLEPFSPIDSHDPLKQRKYILIIPPSPYVCQFYNIDAVAWLRDAVNKCGGRDYHIKHKDGKALSLDGVHKVITFNSSVGWQALAQGIIVDSHSEYSVVGSYYKYLGVDNDIDFLHSDREPLFRFLEAHQFTLAQIEQGDASWLINHYLQLSSAGIPEKQSPPMSPPIVSDAALNPTHRLNT